MARRDYPDTSGSRNTLRAFLVIVALSLIGIIIYKKFISPPGYSNIPKELQINYVPADFNISIDEENALAVLSNPHRYRREFNDLVYDINMSILYHVANRMNLSAEDRGRLQEEYDKHHPYLRNLYFHDFVSLKDTTSQLYQTWYDNEGTNAVDVLKEIAYKYTCFFVTQIITTLAPTKGGSIFAKGQSVDTPCGLALQEALNPMMERLKERAAIEDFSRSRGLLQEKVEKAIAELATMEVRDKKGLNKSMQTRFLGFAVSSSDIEVSAISILKVGFRLNEYFDINLNSKQGIVTITLPEPTILSHEVFPKIDKLDIGWMREVQSVDLNKNFNALRAEFRREALESDIMDKAKANAIELMNTMFTPAVKGLNNRYNIRVQFRQVAEPEEFNPENASATYDNQYRD